MFVDAPHVCMEQPRGQQQQHGLFIADQEWHARTNEGAHKASAGRPYADLLEAALLGGLTVRSLLPGGIWILHIAGVQCLSPEHACTCLH